MPQTKKKTKQSSDEFFVYIIECADGRFYTGYTSNLERRMKEHASGRGCGFTTGFGFSQLLYSESFSEKSTAMKREAAIKKLSRAQKEALIQNA